MVKFITLSLLKTEINFPSDGELYCMVGTEQEEKKIKIYLHLIKISCYSFIFYLPTQVEKKKNKSFGRQMSDKANIRRQGRNEEFCSENAANQSFRAEK